MLDPQPPLARPFPASQPYPPGCKRALPGGFARGSNTRNTFPISVSNGTASTEIYCKDFGGYARVTAILYDAGGDALATKTLEIPKPEPGNTKWIAEKWVTGEFGTIDPDTQNWRGGVWQQVYQNYEDELRDPNPDGDGEPKDPDTAHNLDGGTDLPEHRSVGDNLTVFEEYRGYILEDGLRHIGATVYDHPGGHTRLSPARREVLVEVDVMEPTGVKWSPVDLQYDEIDFTISGQYTGTQQETWELQFGTTGVLGQDPNIDLLIWRETTQTYEVISGITTGATYDLGHGLFIEFDVGGRVEVSDSISIELDPEMITTVHGLNLDELMHKVCEGYGRLDEGAGIDMYYVIDEFAIPGYQRYIDSQESEPPWWGPQQKAIRNETYEHRNSNNRDFVHVFFGHGWLGEKAAHTESFSGGSGQLITWEQEYAPTHWGKAASYQGRLVVDVGHEIWHGITDYGGHYTDVSTPKEEDKYQAEGAGWAAELLFSSRSVADINLRRLSDIEPNRGIRGVDFRLEP